MNIARKIAFFLIMIPVFTLTACDKSEIIDYDRVFSVRTVYDAAQNVYTGTLLDFELFEEGFGNFADTYKVKVEVKEVFKGDFEEGETVEDLCPLGFFDKNCYYMFMTGINKDYGYYQNGFTDAENVYSGKVLQVKLQRKDGDKTPFYDIKVEVEKVYKGDYEVGQTVEDTIVSRLEEIRDGDIFMSAEDKPYINQYRWNASEIVYNISANGYGSVKLLDNGEIELAQRVGEITEVHPGVEDGKLPPKTYEELIARINEPLNYQSEPFILA